MELVRTRERGSLIDRERKKDRETEEEREKG